MRKYTSLFANEYHEKVRSLSELKRWSGPTLALFCNGRAIGIGDLRPKDKAKKHVHTEAVALKDEFRRKGHGVHLYFALIRAAKQLGATRIYSSKTLNKFSGRMWQEKLGQFFEVKHSGPRCKCKCRNCRYKRGWHYIDLTKVSLRSIPR